MKENNFEILALEDLNKIKGGDGEESNTSYRTDIGYAFETPAQP